MILAVVLFVAVLCYITCKVMAYFMDKTFALIVKSKAFRVGYLAALSILFFVCGLFMMSDYFAGRDLKETRIFPLVLAFSVVLLYFAVWAYKERNPWKR
jgi:hypothetical protein